MNEYRLPADVTSPGQIFDIMAEGFEHRAVGCHDINAHSSRSHCLLVVRVIGTNISSGVRTVGKLTLCDLAGSERINKTGATGAALPTAIFPLQSSYCKLPIAFFPNLRSVLVTSCSSM